MFNVRDKPLLDSHKHKQPHTMDWAKYRQQTQLLQLSNDLVLCYQQYSKSEKID